MSEQKSESDSNPKIKAICIVMQTSASNKKFNNEKDKFQEIYLQALDIKEGYQSNQLKHYVAYAIITTYVRAEDLKPYLNPIHQKFIDGWIKSMAVGQSQELWAWKIDHIHELKNFIKYSDSAVQHHKKIEDDILPTLKLQMPEIETYEQQYDILNYYHLTIHPRYIKAMVEKKKLYEFRTWTIREDIRSISRSKIHQYLVDTNQIGKNKKPIDKGVVRNAPLKKKNKIQFESPMTRRNIKQKKEKFDILKFVKWQQPWIGDIFTQQRIDFDATLMACEFDWVLVKSKQVKNLNESVAKHNHELLEYMRSMCEAVDYWRPILPPKLMSVLLNFVHIITTAPRSINRLISIIDSIKIYPRLRAPIAYVLSLIRPGACPECGSFRQYFYRRATNAS